MAFLLLGFTWLLRRMISRGHDLYTLLKSIVLIDEKIEI